MSPHQIDVKDSLEEFENLSPLKLKRQRSPAIKVTGVYTAGDVGLLEVMVKSYREVLFLSLVNIQVDISWREVNKQKIILKHLI